jgi:seryl-tRNA synthetase
MQLKLKEILQNIDSIGKLLNKELPVKTAYRLGRLSKALQSELDQFNLTRNNLIKKYGKEKDGQYQIDPDDKTALEKFNAEIEELLAVDIKIDNYDPITVDELGEIKISPIDMSNLSVFFK